MNAPSWPVSPTALPPCWLMSPTISWLSSPSTISTTFITRSSVTRMPCRNSLLMPILVSRSPICGPPPCTITGFMPTSFSITTSRANPALSVWLGHRVAAVLDDDGLVVEAPDVRKRFGEDLRLERGVDGVVGHGSEANRERLGADARMHSTRGLYSEPHERYRHAAARGRQSSDSATLAAHAPRWWSLVLCLTDMASPLPDPCPLGDFRRARSSPSFAITATCCSRRRCSPSLARGRAGARDRRARVSRNRADADRPSGDRASAHDRPRLEEARASLAQARGEWALLRELRARRYDLLVHLTEHPRGLDARAAVCGRASRSRASATSALRCGGAISRTSTACPRAPSATSSSRTSTRCAASASIPTRTSAASCWCPAPKRGATRRRAARRSTASRRARSCRCIPGRAGCSSAGRPSARRR